MSRSVKDAVIATEDPRFYEHGQVDELSAARALVQNAASNDVASGASTITMHYVRNVLVQEVETILESPDAAIYEQGQFFIRGRRDGPRPAGRVSRYILAKIGDGNRLILDI